MKKRNMKWYLSLFISLTMILTIIVPVDAAQYIPKATDIEITKNIKDIQTAGDYSAALMNNGELWTWGAISKGQSMYSSSLEHDTLRKPSILMDNVKEMLIGNNCSAAIKENGDLYMWGINFNGQLGTGKEELNQLTPTKVLDNVSKVYVLDSYMSGRVAAITTNGDLYMWGSNESGQLGIGNQKNQNTPQKVELANVKKVSLDGLTTAALTNDGKMYVWGYNGTYALGMNFDEETAQYFSLQEPKQVETMSGYKLSDVQVANGLCSALTSDGELYTWCSNDTSSIYSGKKNKTEFYQPEKISENVKDYALGKTSFIVQNNGTLLSFGANEVGEAGTGKNYGYDWGKDKPYCVETPTKILSNVKTLISVDKNKEAKLHAAITNNGSLYAWGDNLYGAVGNGKAPNVDYKTSDYAEPTPVKVADNVKAATHCTNDRSIYLKNDGSLWGCGNARYGVFAELYTEDANAYNKSNSYRSPILLTLKGKSPSLTQSNNQKPSTVGQVKKVKTITINGASHYIAAGKKITLTATISPKDAKNKKVVWSSSNKKVATVSQKGIVSVLKKTGKKSVVITAKAVDGSGAKKTFKITSMKGIVTKVSISGKTTLSNGKSTKLKANIKASSGAYKGIKWTSNNTKYATVSSSGVVKATKSGKGKKVKITAMALDGSGKRATFQIKIK